MVSNPLKKLIDSCNFSKLKNYFAKHENATRLVTNEIVDGAYNKFLQSNNKNISNAYEVIKVLKSYAKERCVPLEQTKEFTAKYYEYIEQKLSREVTKFIDDKINKELIYPIKYPENTTFVRKLLHISPRRSQKDMVEDLRKNLPLMVKSMSEQLKHSHPMIPGYRLNELIYRRLYNNCTKNLGISGDAVNKVFLDNNNTLITKLRAKVKSIPVDEPSAIKEYQEEGKGAWREDIRDCKSLAQKTFDNLIPPHLVSWPRHTLCLDTEYRNLLPKEEREAVDEFNKTVKSLMSEYIAHLDASRKQHSARQEVGYSAELLRNEIALLHYATRNQVVGEKVRGKITISDSPPECKIHNENLLAALDEMESIYYKNLEDNMQKRISLPNNKMCEFERVGLNLIEKLYSEDQSLTTTEKRYVANFLSHITDNSNFNKRIGKILKEENAGSVTKHELLQKLHKYSHKTSHLSIIEDASSRMHNILAKDSNEGGKAQFNDKEKLSIYEVGALQKFDSDEIGDILSHARNKGIGLDGGDKLGRVNSAYSTIAGEKGVLKSFSDRLKQDMAVEDGQLVMDVASKYHQLRHHDMDFNRKLTDFFTSYSHAAVGISRNNPSVSEIWSWYRKYEINPLTDLVNEKFNIHPENLLNPTIKDKINAIGCGQLLNELDKKYQEVARELHSEKEFASGEFVPKSLLNSANRRTSAGTADVVPFGHHGKEEVRTWAQRILEERGKKGEKSIQNILAEETKNEMICSEFAAKMTILTLVELEKKLIAEIKSTEKGRDFEPPKEGIIRLPFNKDENLSKVSPERLVKQLKRVNAIALVEKPGIVKNIIQR